MTKKKFRTLKNQRWILGRELFATTRSMKIKCEKTDAVGWVPNSCVRKPRRDIDGPGVHLFLVYRSFDDLKKFKGLDFQMEVQPLLKVYDAVG